MINDSCYVDLRTAISKANSGATIKLVSGIDMYLSNYFTISKTLTIDL
jgi:hypothetical protein